jgi:hypothetical protein
MTATQTPSAKNQLGRKYQRSGFPKLAYTYKVTRKESEMKKKLLGAGAAVVVLLAGGATVYATTSSKPAPTVTKSVPKSKSSAPKSTSKPVAKTSAPKSTVPVGFNSSKTAFVLPYKLGNLPAGELAFAKSDPAYAAGLLNKRDWFYIGAGSFPTGGWVYMGLSRSTFGNAGLNEKMLALTYWVGVQPSLLAVQVAPVGPFSIPGAEHGAVHTAICLPQVGNGAAPVFVATNVALADHGAPITYQRSAASCNGFS